MSYFGCSLGEGGRLKCLREPVGPWLHDDRQGLLLLTVVQVDSRTAGPRLSRPAKVNESNRSFWKFMRLAWMSRPLLAAFYIMDMLSDHRAKEWILGWRKDLAQCNSVVVLM